MRGAPEESSRYVRVWERDYAKSMVTQVTGE